jgi:uncharacterized membrane protein YkvA (DUF1232 family)
VTGLVVPALVLLAAYAGAVLLLVAAGRREDARAWGGLVPDCVVLVGRLMADPGTRRRDRALLLALAAYLASPIDLVPDMVPVAGQLDDALVVALVLRRILRRAGEGRLRELWPGPPRTRELIARLAGLSATPADRP